MSVRDVRTAILNGILILTAFGLALLPLHSTGMRYFSAVGATLTAFFIGARLMLSAVPGSAVRWRLRSGRVLTSAALVGVLAGLGYSKGWAVIWNSLLGLLGLALTGRTRRSGAERLRRSVRAPDSRRQAAHPD